MELAWRFGRFNVVFQLVNIQNMVLLTILSLILLKKKLVSLIY